LSLRVARTPIVGTFHSAVTSDFPFRAFRLLLLPLYRRIDAPIAVSEVARLDVERHFPGPVRIVPNGVDRSRFRPGLRRLDAWDDGTPNVLFVGRFDPRKGLPELFDAAETLAREGLSFRLILVGDGQLRPYVERRCRGVLAGRVHLEGRVAHDRLPRYYATADVFCSPARGGESFGLVLLEAMACGTPIVTTDLPGHRTVVTPDREGLVVPPRDAEALTRALRALLEDPRARAEMGRRGIETARGYGWDRIVDELESTYEALLGGTPKLPAARPEPAGLPAPV
jgi:phosphatidylinositol alpha-mannosyltransferase